MAAMAVSQASSTGALANQDDALWKEAYDKFQTHDAELYDRLQSIIRKDPGIKKGIGQEQQLGDLLARKRRILEDKQWVFYWHKKAIKIGPQFDKIVKFFKLVKPIGDAAAALDPVHAGIPWACVSVLLPLILNHSEEQEAALNGLQEVTEIVQQFSSLSWTYLDSPKEKSKEQLKDSVVTLYWKILRYEATAINCFSRRAVASYFAALQRKDGWKGLLDDVKNYKDKFMDGLQLDGAENQRRFESDLRELIQGLDRSDEKNLEILRWVSDNQYIERHYTARQLLGQYPEAGEWIHQKYAKWLNSSGSPAFWLRGTIGTGKTSIMSGIVESFYSDVARQDDQRMIYFYCISPTTQDDVIRSLVAQLAWTLDGTTIEQSVASLFNQAKPPNQTMPTPEDWSEALLKLCQRVSKIIIVIDALDECVDFSSLLEALKRLQVKRLERVKFVFSSRMNVVVDKVFLGSDGISLTTEDTSKDMSKYIENEVRSKEKDVECEDETTKRQLSDRIVRLLVDFAGGMFKWVTLQLAIIFPMNTQTFLPGDIDCCLRDIENQRLSPEQSLNGAYETVYSMNAKLGAYTRSVSMAVYKWLLCCRTSLPTDDVLELITLSLNHDPKLKGVTPSPLSAKLVLHCCSNFVIQGSEGTFQFAHLSVKEYLVNHCVVKAEYQQEECHLFAMKTCVAFFADKRIETGSRQNTRAFGNVNKSELWREQPEPTTFPTYSISYWAKHSSKVTSEKRSKELLYKRFVLGAKISPSLQWWYSQLNEGNYSGNTKGQIFELIGWSSYNNMDPRLQSNTNLRILGAAFNLTEVIENAVDKHGEGIDEPVNYDLTPLLVAIRHGSPDAVRYLLDHGANPRQKSYAHRQNIYCGGMGRPIADEDMVYWVTAQGSDRQLHVEERLQVEKVLLNHEGSRQVFLDQLVGHLKIDTHPEPSRALKTVWEAEDETPVSAKIFEYRIKYRGLGELADILDCIDEETFDDDMVLEVVGHDRIEAVKKLFQFKQIDSVTEPMVRRALTSTYSSVLWYLVTRFGHGILTREIVIDEKPRYQEIWKVILDAKGNNFVDQEVFDSLFQYWPDARTIEFILQRCGTEMITSSHVEAVANGQYGFEVLEVILNRRGSLDGLITEEVIIKALQKDHFDMVNFFLDKVGDQSSLLTKRVEEVAAQKGESATRIIRKCSKKT